jgi:hypothetical protein
VRPDELPSDPDQLPLATLHPADGRALRYHLDEFVLTWIASLAGTLSRHPLFESATRHFGREMLELHVEHALYFELLSVSRAYVRRSYLKVVGRPSNKPVGCPADLHALVARHWPDPSVPLVTCGGISGRLRRIAHARHRLMESFRRLGAAPAPAPNAQSMVAVELSEGADPRGKSDAFWLAGDAVDPGRVLFVFELHNRPFLDLEREISTIRRLGAQAIALHPAMSAGGKIPTWIPPRAPISTTALRASLAAARTPLERWLRRVLLTFAERVGYWEAFFRHYRVSVYQHFTEWTPDIAARRLAVDRAEGIEVGKMRSQFFERASPAFHFLHEIAMVWNATVERDLEFSRTRTHRVLEVGYPWDHLFSSKAAAARELRNRLEQAGVRFVITLYDNHPHLNGHFNESHVERFYRHFLELAKAEPHLGLIVKSKKPQVLAMFPAVEAALRELERGGRCVIMNEPLTSIALSALAADLVVAVPASSAACEAAISGRRILMYDPGNCRDHPFAGKDKGLIYPDFDEFQRAVGRCLEGSVPPSGDAGPFLPAIDPFRDGRACRRAGAFIRGYLDARDAGISKPDALARASARYQQALRAVDVTP